MTQRERLQRIRQLAIAIRPPDESEESHLRQRRSQYEKWRLMEQYLQARNMPLPPGVSRSRQWRALLDETRELLDRDISEFICLQIEIAEHHERGVRDLRPARRGDVRGALLEFVEMRKRKAGRNLEWEEAARREGCFRVNAGFHARTREILARHGGKGDEADNFEDIVRRDPWFRS
jgi:ABC-type phosphate transport system auxiliary subunit